MHSPTTPRALLPPSKLFAGLWKSWSVPPAWTYIRRTLCGLLNKVTPTNLDCIADRFAALATSLGRSGDAASVEACGQILIHRCIADPARIGLYAKLVQRAADEVEGESLKWRSVDPYHLDDPATSLPSAVRSVLLSDLVSAERGGHERDARTLAGFAGELLVLGVLTYEDVQDIVVALFAEVSSNSEVHCVVLCRMLRRIVSSTEASHLIDSLSLATHIEGVLEEDTISLKVRYMMMSMLDQCTYPKPRDAFGPDVPRSEIYGFHDEHAEDGDKPMINHATPMADVGQSDTTVEKCTRYAHTFFTTRNVAGVEQFFHALKKTAERRLLTETLISIVMGSGDEANAAAVAAFLALPSVRRVHAGDADFGKVLEVEIIALEDSVLDFPSAYRAMATILHAADLPIHFVEDLASRIIIRENPARDRLLEEFNALEAVADDDPGQYDGATEYTSGEEESASDYAYAY